MTKVSNVYRGSRGAVAPGSARARSLGCHRVRRERLVVDRREDLQMHGQIAAERPGHGVLDESEEPGFDAVTDQLVRYTEEYLMLFDGQWCDPGQIGLPDRV
jgi:hypothetical protein